MQTGNCCVGLTCRARTEVDKITQSKHFTSKESIGCQNQKCVSETQAIITCGNFCYIELRLGEVS